MFPASQLQAGDIFTSLFVQTKKNKSESINEDKMNVFSLNYSDVILLLLAFGRG